MSTQNPFSSAREVAQVFEKDSALRDRLKNDPDPMTVINEVTSQVAQKYEKTNDPVLYRAAVGVLGTLAILAAVGSLGLAAFGIQAPEVLVSLGSAAVGALVGLFAPTPVSSPK
jgi:hypothetical protein